MKTSYSVSTIAYLSVRSNEYCFATLANTKLFTNQKRFTCHMITSNLLSEIFFNHFNYELFYVVDTAMTAFNHWVTMRLSMFRTMGAPGSGKTSVLDLTMGKPPATKRESSDCIETRDITIVPILAHEEEVWETVTKKRMNEMVRKALKAEIDQQHRTLESPDVPPTTTFSSRLPTPPREEVAQETTQQPLKVFTDMVDKLEETEGSKELMDVHWVFTQDTGGQPCYQSVAPLLLRENSCSVITTKLNEKLESKPEFAFFIKGKPIPMSSVKIQLTNLQMIETLVKSQASVNPSQAPKYIIVGTHDDKTKDCEETIGTKNAILKERLSGLEDQRIDNGTTIIFPINAVNPNEEERKKKAKWLRRKILKSPGATVEKSVKIRWFGLLLHLITEDKDTYTLDECLEAGKSLKMDENEIKEALEFFHGLGIMIYFDTKDLGGVIIVKVKVVFRTLSLLLGISFIDRDTLDHEFELNLSANTQEHLQKYGRFKKELLEDEKEFQFSDVFTAKYFLDLLEHVTAVIAVGEEYFLPSALAFATDEEIKQRVKGEPWIIRLTREKETCGPIKIPPPPAYLSSLFINVLKSPTKYKLPLPRFQFSQQYSNAMSLSYSGGGFIHFIQRVNQIEVYFSLCEEDQLHKCHAIRSDVLEATKITEEKLNIPPEILVINDAFLCPCEENSKRHVYVYTSCMKKAQCEESGEYHELTLSQQRWMDEPQGVYSNNDVDTCILLSE